MQVQATPLRSYRYPLAALPVGQTALMSGGRFMVPATVLLGARVLGRRSWGRSLELALVTAGVLHLLGGVVLGMLAATGSLQQTEQGSHIH